MKPRVIGVASSPVRQGAAQAQAAHRRRRLPLPEVGGEARRAEGHHGGAGRDALLPRAEGVRHRRCTATARRIFEELTRIYREEIAELAKEGCTYLQLDDTALPCNCDAHAREDVAARGEDADELTARYARPDQRVHRDAAERHDGGDPSVPRQPQGRLDGRGRLRADRRGAVQPARRRHLLPGVRHRARGRLLAAALPAEGQARDPRPGEHQDAGAGKQGRAEEEDRRGREARRRSSSSASARNAASRAAAAAARR